MTPLETNSTAVPLGTPGLRRLLGCALVLLFAACNAPGAKSAAGALGKARSAVTASALDGGDLTLAAVQDDAGANWYTATLPLDTNVGTISQTLEANWDARFHNLGMAPIYPQGWSLDYYAGANKLASPPSSLSDWQSVTRVVTTGSSTIEGVDGFRQALIADIQAPPVTVPSTFSGGSAGDGWDVFFDPDYSHVFNIHHHDSPPTLMCRNLADSSTCPGFPVPLTQTSTRATGFVDGISGKVWQPTVTYNNEIAWDCVDLNTASRCATPTVISAFHTPWSGYDFHMDPVVVGRKMYAVGFTDQNTARITCLDMASGTECPGVELIENGDSYGSGIDAIGTNLYALSRQNGQLDCWDSTTWTRCPGAWPQQTQSTGRVHAVDDGKGVLNICADWQCWAADGSATTLPPGYLNYASQHHEGALGGNFPQYANMSRSGTRVAWASDGWGQLQCWDTATDSLCSPGFPINVQSLYSAKFDPDDNDCIWTNSDDGVIRNFKISTGAQGCAGGPPRIKFRASISIPRLGCDPASRVFQYKSFQLLAPDATAYTSAKLTIRDSTGTPIPGWVDLALPANGLVDITSLSTAVAGETPIFDIAAVGFTDTSITPSAEFRVTTGSTPQLCWGLAVPALICPNVPGVAPVPDGGPVVTDVVAKGSLTLDGGVVLPFTDQTSSPTVTPNPATVANCGGQLTGNVHLLDGTPIVGAQAFLADSNGVAVVDGSGNPVSAISDANGVLSFGLWASTYKLQMVAAASYSPVTMTVTAGGFGSTSAFGGAVISPAVSTNIGGTSSVDILVTAVLPVAPTLLTPAEGSLLNARTPVLQGACINGDTVRLYEGRSLLCSSPCIASVFACPSSALLDGAHTVFATQSDANGTSPASPNRHFSVDATAPGAPVILAPVSGISRNVTPTVSGSCESGDQVSVYDGADVACSAVCTAGAFSCSLPSLADGSHRLIARQMDPAQNVSPDSAPVTLGIDTVAPVAPALSPSLAGEISPSATPVLSGTCESGAAVSVSEGSAVLCTATCTNGSFSCTSSSLSDGAHAVLATQTDVGGNLSPASPVSAFTVDTTAPAAPVVTTPGAGDQVYDGTTTLQGTAEPGSTVSVSVNGKPVCTAVADPSGNWSCSATLPAGPSTVTATATDAAGNGSSASGAVSFTHEVAIDPPSITSPSANAEVKGLKLTVQGTSKPGSVVTISDDTGAPLCTAEADANGNYQCTGTSTAGKRTLQAKAAWRSFTSNSKPVSVTVLQSVGFAGGGCTAGGSPSPVALLAFGALALMRRRRAQP